MGLSLKASQIDALEDELGSLEGLQSIMTGHGMSESEDPPTDKNAEEEQAGFLADPSLQLKKARVSEYEDDDDDEEFRLVRS